MSEMDAANDQTWKQTWATICSEIVSKEFYCWRDKERRVVGELLNLHGHHMLGRSYTIRDTTGRLWEIRPVPPEINDGMPFSVVDPEVRRLADLWS